MMVTKDGSRKSRQKASAIDRWVKAVTLPIAPMPAETKRRNHSGRFVVVTTSRQLSLRFNRKGSSQHPEAGAEKGGLQRTDLSLDKFDAGVAYRIDGKRGEGEKYAFKGQVGGTQAKFLGGINILSIGAIRVPVNSVFGVPRLSSGRCP